MDRPLRRELSAYLGQRKLDLVDGWLADGAAFTTFLISEWQSSRNISGSVAEIGVHHGKFFILLALLRNSDENAVAVDVFDNQHLNVDKSGKGDYEKFLDNIISYVGSKDGIIIHKTDSLTLKGLDLCNKNLQKLRNIRKKFRIFSVDGSHTAHHTINDIKVAFNALASGGVCIVDDFYNAFWPGVQEGVHKLLSENSEIVIVAYGENKAYLVRKNDYDDYFSFFQNNISDLFSSIKQVELHGVPCIYYAMERAAAAFDSKLRRRSFMISTFGQGSEGIVNLESGWTTGREAVGTWIASESASASIMVPKAMADRASGGCELAITIVPFLHEGRKQRRLEIKNELGESFSGYLKGKTVVRFQVPQAALGVPLKFHFSCETPEAPRDFVPGSSDGRKLALMVTELTISLNDVK